MKVNPNSVAKGKPTLQSSTFENAEASRAVDGRTDSGFSGNSCSSTNFDANGVGTENPWWAVNLEHSYDVAIVQLFNRSDRNCIEQEGGNCMNRLHDVTVEVLQNEDTVQVIHFAGTVADHKKFMFHATGNVIRVTLNGSSKILTLCEVNRMNIRERSIMPQHLNI